jgi:hypothetical protein
MSGATQHEPALKGGEMPLLLRLPLSPLQNREEWEDREGMMPERAHVEAGGELFRQWRPPAKTQKNWGRGRGIFALIWTQHHTVLRGKMG